MRFLFTISLALLLLAPTLLSTQIIQALAPMPERVSNNAVCEASKNGDTYVYSFTGIDSTKIWSGIHLHAWKYDVANDSWSTLPDVPDPMGGKIAAGASVVKNKIYVIGGYHVASNHSEISSQKTHIFDPETDTWLADGADIPVAIDDQVQAVWKDSLIFVVSGWSNTNNVPNVQIYNPSTDTWLVGNAVPNNIQYKVFGASGSIVGDTLYYIGGARYGNTFPATLYLRKGVINPNNPTDILWTSEVSQEAVGYRMAAGIHAGKPVWIGGSEVTYNFNGIAYNGTGGVSPSESYTYYDPASGKLTEVPMSIPPIMDLRGLGTLENGSYILCGGMEDNQSVSNKTYKITLPILSSIADLSADDYRWKVFPNPCVDGIHFSSEKELSVLLQDIQGKTLQIRKHTVSETIDISAHPSGFYNLLFLDNNQIIGSELIEKI